MDRRAGAARLRLITGPAVRVVDLASAKAQCNVDFDDDDTLIQGYVAAAHSWADGKDGVLGRALITQQWALDLAELPRRRHGHDLAIEIPLPPLQSVESVTYWDASGVQQTLDPAAYLVHAGDFGTIEPAPGTDWPLTQKRRAAVSISFTAGYGAKPSQVPEAVPQAMKLLIAHWYRNREAVVGVDGRDSSAEVPFGVNELVRPLRAEPL